MNKTTFFLLLLACSCVEAATIHIIYSHGTGRPQRVEDCSQWYNQPPETITKLKEKIKLEVHFLCSKATDGNVPGSYIYKREEEIKAKINELLQDGIHAKHIFLAGHSAGAWSSLMSMDQVKRTFNAAILFAPACCGPRHEATKYPHWYGKIRPEQIKKMITVNNISAIIFAFEDDPFNRPNDLGFISQYHPKTSVVYSADCGNGHLSHLSNCKMDKIQSIIKEYIESRVKKFPN